MEKLNIPVADLVLDLANPRLVAAETQADALKALIAIGPSYFKNMMTSIKTNGLDPGDSFYVLEDPDDSEAFIVVDGNRRLAALSVLTEPSVLRNLSLSEADVKALTAAAAGYVPGTIASVDCVMFDDRSHADAWIERRHGKDLAGEGRLGWGPLEIDRFQRDHSNLDVIAFVDRNTTMDLDIWKGIKAAVEKNSSTLDRFLSSKALRQMIGLTVSTEPDGSRVPSFSGDLANVLGVLEAIFTDIHAKRINTRTHNSAEDIEKYLGSLPSELRSGETDGKAVRFRDAISKAGSDQVATVPKPPEKPAEKTTRAKPPRVQLAERKHPFTQPETTKGQRLILEASKLNANEFPLASAYTLRAFLEHTIDMYMNEHDIPRAEKGKLIELNRRAELVMDHMIKTTAVSGQDLRGAKRVLTNTKDPSSIQALNDYHHDRYQIPASDALRNAWDACLPLFRAVYGAA